VDGYKRHVLHDLDTGLIRAVGITPANVPEASVTREISADLERQGVCLKELHIDRAYLSSHLVRERSDELEIYCKAWPVRQGKRFSKQTFLAGLGTDRSFAARQNKRCPSCLAALYIFQKIPALSAR
jgi:transposase